jgi:uncharacterized repeat protein (TIGR03803 family)
VIYSFTGDADGSYPLGGVIFDRAGNLYGTTSYGGNSACQDGFTGCGVVYKLAPNLDGTWSQSVLYAFTGSPDGAHPQAGLTLDRAGNLYGTTDAGGLDNCKGAEGCGTVFSLAPQEDGSWSEDVILAFTGFEGGREPVSPVVFDAMGNLYGTTIRGGSSQNGIAFQLQKNPDGSWTERVVHQFSGGKDGRWADSGLAVDARGNLYGTNRYGGDFGYGTAFRLAKTPNGTWSGHGLHQFDYGTDGGFPLGLMFDSAGNLFGTTAAGGSDGYGTVFELTRQAQP